MRWQLLAGFLLIIAVAVGVSWTLARRTTYTQFAVLVSEFNMQQARTVAPSLMAEYSSAGDWGAVQANLSDLLQRQGQISQQASPLLNQSAANNGGVTRVTIESIMTLIAELDSNPSSEGNKPPLNNHDSKNQHWQFEGRWRDLSPALRHLLREMGEINNQQQTGYFVVQTGQETMNQSNPSQSTNILYGAPGLDWVANNLTLANQRALVIDNNGRIVLDTGNDLLGQQVNQNFSSQGIPLYDESGQVGYLVMTSQDGVYTLEQNLFLRAVNRGFISSAILSTIVAFVVAIMLAYLFTNPIRSLTTATAHLQAGEWGYQVVVRGRNEIAQLSQAFNQMSAHLAEQRALRKRLVDDLAHELNTPISLMRLELQGMADGLQTPAEAADHLNQELGEVSDLVANLIFLANDQSTPQRDMQPVDLNRIIDSTLRRFEARASAERKQLIAKPAPALPAINGDPNLILRAISNLVSNALRHTPANGQITIETRATSTHVEVCVKDTGEGIPAEHLPHIFERFYRADNSRSKTSGGRGLGLAIVRQIMEQHGGTASAQSQVGEGSEFMLSWPIIHP